MKCVGGTARLSRPLHQTALLLEAPISIIPRVSTPAISIECLGNDLRDPYHDEEALVAIGRMCVEYAGVSDLAKNIDALHVHPTGQYAVCNKTEVDSRGYTVYYTHPCIQ